MCLNFKLDIEKNSYNQIHQSAFDFDYETKMENFMQYKCQWLYICMHTLQGPNPVNSLPNYWLNI